MQISWTYENVLIYGHKPRLKSAIKCKSLQQCNLIYKSQKFVSHAFRINLSCLQYSIPSKPSFKILGTKTTRNICTNAIDKDWLGKQWLLMLELIFDCQRSSEMQVFHSNINCNCPFNKSASASRISIWTFWIHQIFKNKEGNYCHNSGDFVIFSASNLNSKLMRFLLKVLSSDTDF